MRVRPAALVLGTVGLLVGIAAVLALREATLSTHQPVAEDSSTRIVLSAETKGGEDGQDLEEMVEAILLTCRLEVSSDVAEPAITRGRGVYEAELVPALDHTNERQLRGCLEDWTIDHLRVDVLSIEGG
jgi:hypothetical protein